MAKKNTVLIIAGVAAAAAVVYFMTRPKLSGPSGYVNPVQNSGLIPGGATPPAGGSLLSTGSSLLSSLMGAGGASWLTNLFKGENSPASTYTAGGPADLPKLPSNSYLDITGNEDGNNFLV